MANKPEVRPAVKKSLRSSPAVPSPKRVVAEAQRSAALHAARAAMATIVRAEQQLQFMRELAGLIEAIKHRFVRQNAFLQEVVDLGQGALDEALEELRCADLRVKYAGGQLLTKDTEVSPWAPWPEIEQIAALAAQSRAGGAR